VLPTVGARLERVETDPVNPRTGRAFARVRHARWGLPPGVRMRPPVW